MKAKNKAAKDYSDYEVVITREFNCPRELVFEAWIDPKQLSQWWGPNGFSNPVCEWSAKPGAAIHVVMRGPNGVDYPMGGTFCEVVRPERIVFTAGPLDEKGEMIFELLQSVTFTERNGKTTVSVRASVLKTTVDAAKYLGGHKVGMSQSLERLESLLGRSAR